MIVRRIVASMTVLAMLAGCASQQTADALHAARQNYAVDVDACNLGNPAACDKVAADASQLAVTQQQFHNEVMNNGGAVLVPLAAIAVIGVGVAGAAGAFNGHPHGPPAGPPPRP